jgi:hypothetical protein
MKCKLLRVHSDLAFKDISKALLSSPYTDSTGRGFEVKSKDTSRIVATFIERIAEREEITDPIGNTRSIDLIRYTSTAMRLHKGAISSPDEMLLVVLAPPRSLRSLLSSIASVLDAGIANVDLNPRAIYSSLRRNSRRARVSRVRASRVPLSSTSEMRLEVMSMADALLDLEEIVPKLETIDRLRVEHPFHKAGGYLEISKAGVLTYDENLDDLVEAFVLNHTS